jgi:hypothetical protein
VFVRNTNNFPMRRLTQKETVPLPSVCAVFTPANKRNLTLPTEFSVTLP